MQQNRACQTCCSFLLKSQPLFVERRPRTSGFRGGADLIVHVVFKLLNHSEFVNAVRLRTARFASSLAWLICADKPCFAAISSYRCAWNFRHSQKLVPIAVFVTTKCLSDINSNFNERPGPRVLICLGLHERRFSSTTVPVNFAEN